MRLVLLQTRVSYLKLDRQYKKTALPFNTFKIYSSTHLFYNLFRSCKPYSCSFNFFPFPYLVAPKKSCLPEEKLKKVSIFNQQSVENEFLTTSKKESIRKPLGAFG